MKNLLNSVAVLLISVLLLSCNQGTQQKAEEKLDSATTKLR